MNFTENELKQELGGIMDPDLRKNLDELNAIKKITIQNNLIQVYLELVQPIHWVAERINNACAELLDKITGGAENEIFISEKPNEDGDRKFLKGVKNIIAVASGKGGVGKSAIASNIAASLSIMGANVGILDGDVYGPSQPTMFGLSGEALKAVETEDGKTIAYPHEKYNIKIASMGFVLNRDEAAIVRGPLLAGYFSLLFEQVDWGALDFLVFDLPPGTGDIQLTLTQKISLTGVVIVTTPQEIAIADVRRSIAMFRRVNVDILGIIENMSYFEPPDAPGKRYNIFGEGGGQKVADESGVKLLGKVPIDLEMRRSNDGGKPIVLDDAPNKQADVLKIITSNIVSEIRRHNYDLLEKNVVIDL